jgi:ABC-type branched-subunit amino acid transport system substrate-binding protein
VTRKRARSSLVALLVLALVAAALAGCGGSGGAATGERFKIGLIVPLTGPVAADGIPLKNGFDLALKEINAQGGVLGEKVEVVTLDNQSDPALSSQQATRLIRQDKVDYLVGTITGAEQNAVGQVADAARVPFSNIIMGTPPFCSRYVWSFGETNQMLLKPFIPELVKRYGKKVALVGSDYNFPHEYHEVAKELVGAEGGTVVAEEYSPLGTSDWQPVTTKLAAADPDWILSAVVGGDAIAFVKQAQQFGLLKKSQLTGVSFIQEYYPPIAPIANGRILVSRYSEQLPGEGNADFVKRYRAAYEAEGPIPGVAANAFDAVRFIAKAVNAAGSADKEKVIDELAKTQIDGIYGPDEHFTENQRFQTPMHLTRIAEGGKYVPLETYPEVVDDQPCG